VVTEVDSNIPISKVWHYDEWFVVYNIGTKKLYQKGVNGAIQMPCIDSERTENIGMPNLRPNLAPIVMTSLLKNDEVIHLDFVVDGLRSRQFHQRQM
jgi:hypothetical protein